MSIEANYTASPSILLPNSSEDDNGGSGAWGSPSYSPDEGLTNMTIEEFLLTALGPQQVCK